MARMIPSTCPSDTPSGAERTLFSALAEQLDDEWTVIHSLPWLDDTRRRLQQGECDFLLVHPRHGMLAVEAKSGEVSYHPERKRWERHGRPINKDPFLQAQRSVHTLNGLLNRDVAGWSRGGLPFGFAAALPDCDRLIGTFPPHVSPDLVILKQDVPQLTERIVAIRDARITHILVHWGELQRYRSLGNYGYSGFVTRSRVHEAWVREQGLLRPLSTGLPTQIIELFQVQLE